jgi:hypothetical protein
MTMIPGRDRSVFDGWVTIDSICMWNRVECNPLITWVGVEAGEVIDVGCCGCGFHFSFCGLDIYI